MTIYEDLKSKNIDEMAKQLTVFEFNTIIMFCDSIDQPFTAEEKQSMKNVFGERCEQWKKLLESECENDG